MKLNLGAHVPVLQAAPPAMDADGYRLALGRCEWYCARV